MHKRPYKILTLHAVCLIAVSPAFANELADRLAQLTPDYPAPPLEVLEAPGDPAAAVALVGVSLEQDGERLTDDLPRIDSSAPLDVITYWRARQRLTTTVSGELAFWDHLSLIRQTQRVNVGPQRGEAAWETGGVYTTRRRVDPGPIARQFSGNGSLVVAINGRAADSRQPLPRQLLDIHLMPELRPSTIAEDEIEAALDEAFTFLPHHIRLGKGATIAFDIPESSSTGNTRMAIISSTSYRGGDQGAPLCRITLNPGAPGSAERTLLAGEHTSLRNYDAVPPTAVPHEKATVFISRDSGQVGEDGGPIRFHEYVAEFAIPESVASLNRIRFECLAPVILDIEGILLLR